VRPLPHGLVEVWDYLAGRSASLGPGDGTGAADAIVCLGSANLGTARRAAVLFHEGVAPRVVVSGGTPWPGAQHATEADAFTAELLARDVPAGAVVVERRATNTGENARFALDTLDDLGVSPGRLVVVCFPTLCRRATATFALVAPAVAVDTVPAFDTFDEFEESPQRAVDLVVAEVGRLATYPDRGLTAPVEVPDHILRTAARLAATSTPSGASVAGPGPQEPPGSGFPLPA